MKILVALLIGLNAAATKRAPHIHSICAAYLTQLSTTLPDSSTAAIKNLQAVLKADTEEVNFRSSFHGYSATQFINFMRVTPGSLEAINVWEISGKQNILAYLAASRVEITRIESALNQEFWDRERVKEYSIAAATSLAVLTLAIPSLVVFVNHPSAPIVWAAMAASTIATLASLKDFEKIWILLRAQQNPSKWNELVNRDPQIGAHHMSTLEDFTRAIERYPQDRIHAGIGTFISAKLMRLLLTPPGPDAHEVERSNYDELYMGELTNITKRKNFPIVDLPDGRFLAVHFFYFLDLDKEPHLIVAAKARP